jgi:hypothetical protein
MKNYSQTMACPAAWRNPDLPSREFKLLIELLSQRYVSEEAVTSSHDILARNLAESRDAVITAMDKLTELGWVEKSRSVASGATVSSRIRYYIIHVIARPVHQQEVHPLMKDSRVEEAREKSTIDQVIAGELEANTWIIEGVPVDGTDAPALIMVDPGTEPDRILSSIDGHPVAAVLLRHGHYRKATLLEGSDAHCYLADLEKEILPRLRGDICEGNGIEYKKSYIDFMFSDDEFEELAELKVEFSKDSGIRRASGAEIAANPLTTEAVVEQPTKAKTAQKETEPTKAKVAAKAH